MHEVKIELRFITPCLGNVRGKVDRMQRNSDGQVIFLQTWWRGALTYAAKAMSKYIDSISKIQWDPVIRGETTIFKRFYSNTSFKSHEAFDAGSHIFVNAMLPNEILVDDFKELLHIAGTYVGISPYGWKKDYGRFEVVSVDSRHRNINENKNT